MYCYWCVGWLFAGLIVVAVCVVVCSLDGCYCFVGLGCVGCLCGGLCRLVVWLFVCVRVVFTLGVVCYLIGWFSCV